MSRRNSYHQGPLTTFILSESSQMILSQESFVYDLSPMLRRKFYIEKVFSIPLNHGAYRR
ncbi:hypothetical protein AB3N59_06255 [Leptospira sp. WS92.C1]